MCIRDRYSIGTKSGNIHAGISNIIPETTEKKLELKIKNFNKYNLPRFSLELWSKATEESESVEGKETYNYKYLIDAKFKEKLPQGISNAMYLVLWITFSSFIGAILLVVWNDWINDIIDWIYGCLLYTSPSPRDLSTSRMPSSA